MQGIKETGTEKIFNHIHVYMTKLCTYLKYSPVFLEREIKAPISPA